MHILPKTSPKPCAQPISPSQAYPVIARSPASAGRRGNLSDIPLFCTQGEHFASHASHLPLRKRGTEGDLIFFPQFRKSYKTITPIS